MRRKSMLVFSILFVALVVCLYLSADEGTITGDGEGVGPDETVIISLEKPFGIPITKIPKGDEYFIWASWSTPVNGPKVTYIVTGVDQDTTRKYTHIIVKENTQSGVIGEAVCTAIVPWADSGQKVPIIAKVDGIGTGFKTFLVE